MKLLLYHSSQHENQEQEAGSTTGAVVTHKQHVLLALVQIGVGLVASLHISQPARVTPK